MSTTKEPLVSIITVTYNLIEQNRQNQFIKCINSIHDQTYPNIEHILIDGGSNDGSLELIKNYEAKGWIKYITEKDSGIYNAMNKGLKLAKGKYVAFLNSDDEFHDKQAVTYSVNALEKSKAAFSYAPVLALPHNKKKYNPNHPILNPQIINVFSTMPFSHQSMFARKDVLIKEGGFNEEYKSAGDYDLVLRLCLKNYKSIKVNKRFCTFSFGGVSSINKKQSLNEVAKIYQKHYGKLCSLTFKEASKIYDYGYLGISPELANNLQKCIYFDYSAYSKFIYKRINMSHRLMKQILYLKEECNKIYDSRSWRITKKITTIAKFLKLK